MMPHLSREDRILGCVLAGALGDAVGAQFEGNPPSDVVAIPRKLRVTDDTQLTLATCEGIIEANAIIPERIASSFVRWYRKRMLTGIGASTLSAITQLDAGGHWATVGATGERSAGNGAAMRIAPLAFFLDANNPAHRTIIRDVCRITHRNDEAYVGALAIIIALQSVIAGNALNVETFTSLADGLPDSRVRDRILLAGNASLTPIKYVEQFGATGYVVDSVPLAILAACHAVDLLTAVTDIVKLGGDTDSIASMCGQIIGAAQGATVVPRELVDRIDLAKSARKMASQLARVSIRL